ncbi:uncharacterized protein LOC119669830 [Teleopsis dalmanni]|uniref:uncharacterized protein LOC119669830 n=1 Tax=Teleopsis dalmanni TaxID=139649 RepID=UPI0018CE4E50|nr:uncharacterized protein LOC119669830 [Teleopsis dalmanni]XP_037935789.1 uncharacterized protein LOC119669830 [Teleopsis dalmanni]
MRRALILATIICVFSVLNVAEARWTTTTRKSRTTTTTTPTTKATPTTIKTTTAAASNNADDDRTYHPAEVLSPRLIERFDKRSLDGHYEYRYVLSNGDTRYERAYWIPVGKKMVLARKGYYSYPMPNGKFLTVFYTADQNGFHEVSCKYEILRKLYNC